MGTTGSAAFRSDNRCVQATADIRLEMGDYLDSLATEAMQSSLPIVRPLWMFNSLDPVSYEVDDQFIFGDRFLVAPILTSGQRQRDVYLPKMVKNDSSHEEVDVYWKNRNDGRIYGSGEWLRNVKVALD